MKIKLILPQFFLLLWLLASNVNAQSVLSEDSIYFKIEFIQDGQVVQKEGDFINLKRAPFQFKLWYRYGPNFFQGISNSASLDRYYYDYPDTSNIFACDISSDDFWTRENLKKAGCRFFGNKSPAISMFNMHKSLHLSDGDIYNSWDVSSFKCDHVLDPKIWVENGEVFAEYTVDSILNHYRIDEKIKPYRQHISEMEEDIYMVFAKKGYRRELQREKFILRFYGDPVLQNFPGPTLIEFRSSRVEKFLQEVYAAVRSHDRDKLMEMVDEDYIKEQHDKVLDGRTKQFIDELFSMPLENITEIRQLSIKLSRSGFRVKFEVSDGTVFKSGSFYLKQCLDEHIQITFGIVGAYG